MSAFDRQAVGARGGGYGLDAELAKKREAEYDYAAEDDARAWIETITKEPCEGPFGMALRNGVLLCKLVNCISPGSVRKINESRMPFKQMENISNFLKACRALGVAEHSLFETVDLFEDKDIGLVVRCVFALGSTVQTTCPDFHGPHLGAKQNQVNKRVFSDKQKQQARVNSAFAKLTMGSAGCMERSQVLSTGITFGAENAGMGDTTVVAKLSKGSHGLIERLPVDKSKSITFGAESVGVGDSTVMTKSSLGSYGIMERATVSKTGITFGADNAGVEPSTVPVTPVKDAGAGTDTPFADPVDHVSISEAATAAVTDGTSTNATADATVVKTMTENAQTLHKHNSMSSAADDASTAKMQSTDRPSPSVDEVTRSWFQARSGR